MAISEVIRFVLPASRRADFAKLREHVSAHAAVKTQYFGSLIAPANAALPIRQDEVCWVLQWSGSSSEMRTNADLRARMSVLAGGQEAKSLLFQFEGEQLPNLANALEAPVCEFAIINLVSTAPKSNPDFKHSMHKTYTDCYRMHGFVGGDWAYATNTNDTDGEVLDAKTTNRVVDAPARSLACYYLGWESIEAHQAASKTSIFDEEIEKLAPWFGPGSGAWYVKFEKQAETAAN